MPAPSFAAYLLDLTTQAHQIGAAAAASGVAKRVWQIPSQYPASTDVQEPDGFIDACNRDDLNELAIAGYQRGHLPNDYVGRVGVVAAAKLAIDHMGAHERALHARHASPVRLRAWAAARRTGHSDVTYGVFGCIGRYAASMLEQANAVGNSQV
jgi:hypothetical protein